MTQHQPATLPHTQPPITIPRVHIGTAGWSIPRTSADVFPEPGSHLERYARVLPCTEINATFYRRPRPSTLNRWAASVPSEFRFSVKAPKTITHAGSLGLTTLPQLRAFLDDARELGPHLGPLLFQLPPRLAFDPPSAQQLFTMLRDLYTGPVALEPRHPTWFDPAADTLLTRLNIARAAADPAILPAAAQPGGSPSLVYYRLHGSPRTYYSTYTEESLLDLASNLHTATTSGNAPAELWCIFDNTAAGAAAANALTLQALLQVIDQPAPHAEKAPP